MNTFRLTSDSDFGTHVGFDERSVVVGDDDAFTVIEISDRSRRSADRRR